MRRTHPGRPLAGSAQPRGVWLLANWLLARHARPFRFVLGASRFGSAAEPPNALPRMCAASDRHCPWDPLLLPRTGQRDGGCTCASFGAHGSSHRVNTRFEAAQTAHMSGASDSDGDCLLHLVGWTTRGDNAHVSGGGASFKKIVACPHKGGDLAKWTPGWGLLRCVELRQPRSLDKTGRQCVLTVRTTSTGGCLLHAREMCLLKRVAGRCATTARCCGVCCRPDVLS